jgi:transposase-like protein
LARRGLANMKIQAYLTAAAINLKRLAAAIFAIFEAARPASKICPEPLSKRTRLPLFNNPVVHWYRNIFSHVPSTRVREIAAMLTAIHAGEDIAAARQKAVQVIEKLRGLRLNKAAELVETAVEETLAYYSFPGEHWRRIRTNNPLERILREIRRRTRVVGSFPDGQSALNLAAARLRHIASTNWSTKRYLTMELLKDQQMRGVITA